MWPWIAGRPQHCLRIGTRELAWAEAHRDWKGRVRHRCAVVELAPGLIQASPVDPNIADVPALEARIRGLVGPERQLRLAGRTLVSQFPLPIVLVLPDLCVRAVVFQLDRLPARTEEREALIRWRFGQEQLFPVTDAKVFSQVLSDGRPAKGPHTVLAVAVQEAVLAQYESVCESVGLIPSEVDVVSFRLFNLWALATGWSSGTRGDLMWLNLADGGLTLFIFHEGRLAFLRTKLLGGSASSAHSTATQSEGRGRKVVEECLASIQACQESQHGLALTRLVFAADDPDPELPELLADELDFTVHTLNWSQAQRVGWRPSRSTPPPVAIPAIAGIL